MLDACEAQPLDRQRTFGGSRSHQLAQRGNQHGVEAVSLRPRQDVVDRTLRQGFLEGRESSEEIDDKIGVQARALLPRLDLRSACGVARQRVDERGGGTDQLTRRKRPTDGPAQQIGTGAG
jgi:hypothetical protein